MNDDAFIIVLGTACAGMGAVFLFAMPGVTPELIVAGATACAALGTVIGIIIAVIRKSLHGTTPPASSRRSGVAKRSDKQVHNTVTRARRTKTSRTSPPKPFRERLANFTHQDESEVMAETDSYKSKMPFWSAVSFLSKVPPKSAQLIRYYLIAIRRAAMRRDRKN